jgi:novobiocin biosynthesis protein NovU
MLQVQELRRKRREPTSYISWVEGQIQLFCRVCGNPTFTIIDLGHHPFANALVDEPNRGIKAYPLALHACKVCAAAQLSYCADDQELYQNYTYITPKSTALLTHYGQIVSFLRENGYMTQSAHLLEVGSNIGRFLGFVRPYVTTILGIDPAVNITRMANKEGIPTINDFFDDVSAKYLLSEYGKQDVIVARHCFAHNEKPWLMVEGVLELLADNGVFVIENAYFLDTVMNYEFDQIYHEHMYYHSLRSISQIVSQYGLKLVDVYHSAIHGGTMVYIVKFASAGDVVTERVTSYLEKEKFMHTEAFYHKFSSQVKKNKVELGNLLEKLKSDGKTIHAYGASAKSTTLLNYYRISSDIVPYVVDSTITKHGKYIPLANIKVISEEDTLKNAPPDYYLLTIWNYKDEVIKKVRASGNHETKFILPHPQVMIVD